MDKRRLERIFLPRPTLVQSGMLGFSDSAAVLRDISATGAYLYTLLPLANGDVVHLFLTLSDSEGTLHLCFTGAVTRVESGATSNSVGVAVAFSGFKELAAGTASA
jgi:hypothetical protein